MLPNKNLVTIGRFGKTKGINGHIRLYSFANPIEQVFSYPLTHKDNQAVIIDEWSFQNDFLIVKLRGIDSPEDAQRLVNQEIFTQRSAFPRLPEGEYYWHDLIGTDVIDQEDTHLGTVTSLINNGAQDLLVISLNNQEMMIPFVKQHVLDVNLETLKIHVLWKSI